MEEIESMEQDKAALKMSLGLNTDKPVLALLPGSRPHELKSLLPIMLDVVTAFASKFPDYNYQFIMPVALILIWENIKASLSS